MQRRCRLQRDPSHGQAKREVAAVQAPRTGAGHAIDISQQHLAQGRQQPVGRLEAQALVQRFQLLHAQQHECQPRPNGGFHALLKQPQEMAT